jgi:hypothetical protein
VTFAAFIYLPASFAAAIFGMNVQEINETGRGIASFVVTAVVLLVATLLLWGMSVQIVRYRKDRRSNIERFLMHGGEPPEDTLWHLVLDTVFFVDKTSGNYLRDLFWVCKVYIIRGYTYVTSAVMLCIEKIKL